LHEITTVQVHDFIDCLERIPPTSSMVLTQQLFVNIFRHVSCLHWHFKCDDGQECIHSMAKCDGHQDCSDGSDESPHWCRNVAIDNWPCDDRKASIPRSLICNGLVFDASESFRLSYEKEINPRVNDCNDESDEAHCRCASPSHHFDCAGVGSFAASRPGECISRELMCNGVSNCYGGQDEAKQVLIICFYTHKRRNGPKFIRCSELY
uniref:Low-density lipoprotein receptor domain class A n=1 Tax=Gongylonema pulchrum TaxID=637853 RepID=A0A183EWU0_9BILA